MDEVERQYRRKLIRYQRRLGVRSHAHAFSVSVVFKGISLNLAQH